MCDDWLLHRHDSRCAALWRSELVDASARYGDGAIELTNGLISRVFATRPSFALLALERTGAGRGEAGASASFDRFSRGVGAEGLVLADGINYSLGGLKAPGGVLYLNRTALREAEVLAHSFTYLRHRQTSPRLSFEWTPGRRHSDHLASWPPRGTALQVDLCAPTDSELPAGLMTSIHYELYDGLPVVFKRVELRTMSRACAAQRQTQSLGPPKGCVTVGGLSVERLQLAPRLLGVPHVDENWQYMQGARMSIFSDLTRPGAAYVVERDASYRSS
eukprot:1156759-Prymnesium_polylepis.1